MGDMGDVFNAAKKQSQEKRAVNRDNAQKILSEKKIKFTVHNAGAHLVVDSNSLAVDFWGGTGKWIVRKSGVTGRGVFNLIKFIEKNNDE